MVIFGFDFDRVNIRGRTLSSMSSIRPGGDFSMRGQFLNGRPVPEGNGMTRWEVSLDGGHRPTAVAQKVLTVYLMPGVGGVGVQIHAAVAPLDQRRPMHIKIIPGSDQVGRIEREFPGFTGAAETRNGGSQFWMSGRISGTNVDDADLIDIIRMTFRVGLQMFDGPFTGWFYATDF